MTFNKLNVQIRQLSIEEIREVYSGFNCDQKINDPDWENFFPWGIEERIETETGVKILFAYPKDIMNLWFVDIVNLSTRKNHGLLNGYETLLRKIVSFMT